MPISKPARRSTELKNRVRIKEVLVLNEQNSATAVPALRRAAEVAVYTSSEYHRPKGSLMEAGAPTNRTYPASKCDPSWTRQTATSALREAIRAGRVSLAFEGLFPRYAWYQHADVLYEARLTNRESGEYHAYPLEDRQQWPADR